jgi:hypothetical protein
MSFVLLIAAAAILGGVVAVAMGWGGEITLFARDIPEVSLRPRTPYDVAMLRLPAGLLGYQRQATDDALNEAAGLLAERDAEIARLWAELERFATPAPAGPAAGAERPPPAPTAVPLPMPSESAAEPPAAASASAAGPEPPVPTAVPLPMPSASAAEPPALPPSPSAPTPSVPTAATSAPSSVPPADEDVDIISDASDSTGVQA